MIAPSVAPVTTARSGELVDRLAALDEAVAHGEGRLPAADLAAARELIAKAGSRLALDAELTVVALAGATGSGKSSLFNSLAGTSLSTVGVRRPTTGVAHACVWGDRDAGPLLDWLDVPHRHQQLDGDPRLAGLVLLDFPDHDSTDVSHRLVVDRLVELVDLLVWVLDPQKYADAAVHRRYLIPYARHADVLLVVLNQLDRLSASSREECLADLGRVLVAEGLSGVPVLGTAVPTGTGVPALIDVLVDRVSARRAAADRLLADVQVTANRLQASCAPPGGRGRRSLKERGAGLPADGLTDALADAAGIPAVVDAVARAHRLRAAAATGWPPTRWLTRLRPDPVRRLRLADQPNELARTSLPGPSAVAAARVATALRTVADSATAGLPTPWSAAVRRRLDAVAPTLPERLDVAVAGTDLGLSRSPRWWSVVRGLQLVLLSMAGAGALWLAALAGLSYLQLDLADPPRTSGLPVPTLLLLAGLLGGLLLALLSRRLAAVGARRRARRAARRLRERVGQVASTDVLEPVHAELAAYDSCCAALTRAAG